MNKADVLQAFKNFFPGKTVAVVYDDSCVSGIANSFINGAPELYGSMSYNRVRVDVQDFPSQYVGIDEDSQQIGNKPLRDWLSSKVNVVIPQYDLNELASRKAAAEAPGAPQSAIDAYNAMLADLANQSGYSQAQILAML
jgi:hypothetical protein